MQNSRDVFVVHGRNLEARDSIFAFLRSIDLHPKEWEEAISDTGKASPYIGEVLDVAFSKAQAIVVLLTPDDEAILREQFRSPNDPAYESQLTPQARPNVIFEAGMALGRSADRTVIIEIGELRPFNDIFGRHVVRLNNSSTKRQDVAQRLEKAGCAVNLLGRDWHKAGNFEIKSTKTFVSNFDSVKVLKKKKEFLLSIVYFPQIVEHPNKHIELRINLFLRREFWTGMDGEPETQWEDSEAIYNLNETNEETEDSTNDYTFDTAKGVDFSTKLNKNGILSIKYEWWATGGAHPIHNYKAFSIELNSGYVFNFEDLFRPESHYLPVINNLIYKSLKQENMENFEFNEKKQYDFYLTKKHLVIFNIFDFHAAQGVEAKINLSEIEYIINQLGPLQKLFSI